MVIKMATSNKPLLLGAAADDPDQGAPMPRYRRIREQILNRIVEGKLKRGDAIDSEVQMAKQFGVSLGTVRKAVDDLVAQNVLERRQGKGTFVASRDSVASQRLSFHVFGDNDSKELPAFQKVLALATRLATPVEANRLQLPARANVVDLLRTRAFSDGAMMCEQVVLPTRLFPQFEKRLGKHRPTMIYEFYESEFGVSVKNFEERVRAINATKEDASVIGCDVGAALLEIERLTFGFDDTPVELRIGRLNSAGRYYLHPRH
jgi:GntR family transcriptional regulator